MQLPVAGAASPEPAGAPMLDLFFITVVLAAFAAFRGLMRLLDRL